MNLYPRHDCPIYLAHGFYVEKQRAHWCPCRVPAARLTVKDLFSLPEREHAQARADLGFPSAEPETVTP